jgi:hypothetical protein
MGTSHYLYGDLDRNRVGLAMEYEDGTNWNVASEMQGQSIVYRLQCCGLDGKSAYLWASGDGQGKSLIELSSGWDSAENQFALEEAGQVLYSGQSLEAYYIRGLGISGDVNYLRGRAMLESVDLVAKPEDIQDDPGAVWVLLPIGESSGAA